MQRNYKIKLFFALIIPILAFYIIYPSFVYFSLSNNDLMEIKSGKNTFNKHIPKWFMNHHIVPGLDIQGGISIILKVNINKVISSKIIRIQDNLKNYAKKTNINCKILNKNTTNKVCILFSSKKNIQIFKKKIHNEFHDLITHSRGNKLFLKFKPQYINKIQKEILEQTVNIIKERISKIGIIEHAISKQGKSQIQVQLPGYHDPSEAKKIIGRTAELFFQICNDDNKFLINLKNLPKNVELKQDLYKNNTLKNEDIYLYFNKDKLQTVRTYLKNKVPNGLIIKYGKLINNPEYIRTYTLFKKIELSGKDLIDVGTSINPDNINKLNVRIKFNSTGARIFDKLTKEFMGKRIAIVLENKVNSAPIITQRIRNGDALIYINNTNSYKENEKEAMELSCILKSGALPAPIIFLEERSIGPSLGLDSINSAKKAFIIGALLVSIFMIICYKKSGIIAIIGLLFNILIMLSALSLLNTTITLPGIAGILLIIGMAVDANIIINERIKEKIKLGNPQNLAIKYGYTEAKRAIIDANITTFIIGIILYNFGSDTMQNFAIMLIIGTISSLISAVLISRIFFDILMRKNSKSFSINNLF